MSFIFNDLSHLSESNQRPQDYKSSALTNWAKVAVPFNAWLRSAVIWIKLLSTMQKGWGKYYFLIIPLILLPQTVHIASPACFLSSLKLWRRIPLPYVLSWNSLLQEHLISLVNAISFYFKVIAEGEEFESPLLIRVNQFSRLTHSATLPTFQWLSRDLNPNSNISRIVVLRRGICRSFPSRA